MPGSITSMNVFETDHPMVSQQSRPATRKEIWVSYGWSLLTVALILCPLFLAVTWVGMSMPGTPETPDVPDESAYSWLPELLLTVCFGHSLVYLCIGFWRGTFRRSRLTHETHGIFGYSEPYFGLANLSIG
jgi:hypothetical protein